MFLLQLEPLRGWGRLSQSALQQLSEAKNSMKTMQKEAHGQLIELKVNATFILSNYGQQQQ